MKITESFAIGNSYIHHLDPRIRILFAFFLSVTIALTTSFSSLCLALFISIGLILLARLKWREIGKRLSVVLGFLILIWLILPITFEGEAIGRLGTISIYREGILLSARITLKSFSILMVFISLMATMSIATIGHALHRLRVPDKLVFLFLITYRYLFVIGEENSRLRTAIRFRCFRPGTNIHSFKTIAYLVGMLFVRASVRAERVNQAMRLRGFKGRYYSLEEYSAYKTPGLFLLTMTGVITMIVVMEWISV